VQNGVEDQHRVARGFGCLPTRSVSPIQAELQEYLAHKKQRPPRTLQ